MDDLQSNRMRVSMPPGSIEAYGCPVESCSWTKTVADIELETAHVPIEGSGPTLSDAISAAMIGRAKATEKILRDHLESHDVIDFMQTIRSLENQLYNARHDTGVRPHRRQNESAAYRQRALEGMDGVELVNLRDAAQAAIVERAQTAARCAPHRVEGMTGVERGRAAETLQRYEEIDDAGPFGP